MSNKVFGIISYFPEPDTSYHKYVRQERMSKCSALLKTLHELWPDINIMVIAQNWKDYKPPFDITVFEYPEKLGILAARKTLRQKFLESDYNYLITLDDDAAISCTDPMAYIRTVDCHPDGVAFVDDPGNSLNLAAVSRHVMSQVDYPEVRREAGEGFEDLVFRSICAARFPMEMFKFPNNCVEDVSGQYENRCPSTWASERRYNWDYMFRVTDALVEASQNTLSSPEADYDIDLILPFVNPEDPAWLSDFNEHMPSASAASSRFRNFGTLKYLLRGIAEYMPFVRNVVLVVASESQIPDWLDRSTIRIVTHKEFIPEEFLPTFSSCTIESFLYNIPDLAEHIIYFNDDVFPVKPLSAADFFTNGVPRIRFNPCVMDASHHIYDGQCRSGMDLITDMLQLPRHPTGEFLSPGHTAFPMLRSTLEAVGERCNDAIKQSVTSTRSSKNLNQYIYHYYQYFTGAYVNSACDFLYLSVKDPLDRVKDMIVNPKFSLICINDSIDLSDTNPLRNAMIQGFSEKFPKSSRFEKKLN